MIHQISMLFPMDNTPDTTSGQTHPNTITSSSGTPSCTLCTRHLYYPSSSIHPSTVGIRGGSPRILKRTSSTIRFSSPKNRRTTGPRRSSDTKLIRFPKIIQSYLIFPQPSARVEFSTHEAFVPPHPHGQEASTTHVVYTHTSNSSFTPYYPHNVHTHYHPYLRTFYFWYDHSTES